MTDLTAPAIRVLMRRYDCDTLEAADILREWSEKTSIEIDRVAYWVMRDAYASNGRYPEPIVDLPR
ncbi:MAG TPA: hypothetical protein VGH76_03285 [Actinomycetospora sp.]|jgi:hypothetical protein|uniref:hypothetical protein n=1 Tax=Actinomycetospora sp. TaxID=1872135 RepID=UPI002F42F6E5